MDSTQETQVTDAQGNRISLRGFSKESVEMIRELEAFGWVFRPSNHGAVGHAPHDKTTISVSRSLNKHNRGLKRAQSDFKRWLRIAHPELSETADAYVAERGRVEELAESDPVVAGILERRAIVRTKEQIDTLTDPIVREHLARFHEEAQTDTDKNGDITVAAASITESRPWHGKTGVRDGLTRVIERTWSTGRIDYACAYEGCPVTSSKARSIAQHYGAVHTRAIDTYINPAATPEPEPVEAEGLPWEALAETVEELRESEPASVPVTDPEPMPGDESDAYILRKVQHLVGAPLLAQVRDLTEQVETLTKERDEAREHLAKIQSDWDALRSLLGGASD
jgi:hypothetical protein